GKFSHRFTDFRKNPELTFASNVELSPLWFKFGSNFEFKPFSCLSFSIGGSIGTSWGFDLGFLSLDFIGEYDREEKDYESFTPLTHWVYDGWAQVSFKYDIGSLLSSGKQHVIFGSSYKAQYAGMTGVENGEIWKNQGSGEQVNGFSYTATTSMNYMIPHKYFKSIGLTASASGYYSDDFFDEEYRIYDPTFVNLTFALISSASVGYKNHFMLMIPVSGKRDFDCDDNLVPLTEPDGREWIFDGVILTYTHIF
ncbi:MAG: hypothetical protein K6F69_06745, partial [Treponema sp.]|nr:hypothetical protein [Treponema sp.]